MGIWNSQYFLYNFALGKWGRVTPCLWIPFSMCVSSIAYSSSPTQDIHFPNVHTLKPLWVQHVHKWINFHMIGVGLLERRGAFSQANTWRVNMLILRTRSSTLHWFPPCSSTHHLIASSSFFPPLLALLISFLSPFGDVLHNLLNKAYCLSSISQGLNISPNNPRALKTTTKNLYS